MLKKNKSFFVFLVFAALFLVWGIFLVPGDELFFALLAQYLILPITAFICSVLCVKKGTALGWLSPVIFAAVIILLPFVAFGKTDLVFAAFALVPCISGFVLGAICKLFRKSAKTKKEEASANA